MKNLFIDKNGKLSSKRVFGFVGLIATIGLTLFAIIYASEFAIRALYPLAGITTGLLGATTFERKQ